MKSIYIIKLYLNGNDRILCGVDDAEGARSLTRLLNKIFRDEGVSIEADYECIEQF